MDWTAGYAYMGPLQIQNGINTKNKINIDNIKVFYSHIVQVCFLVFFLIPDLINILTETLINISKIISQHTDMSI